jgi:hypothetical protein
MVRGNESSSAAGYSALLGGYYLLGGAIADNPTFNCTIAVRKMAKMRMFRANPATRIFPRPDALPLVPTPSSRLSSSGGVPSIAATRQTEPQKLSRFIKGELDWIVMKAFAKERERRYETVSGFAKDIERFLNHEPVLRVRRRRVIVCGSSFAATGVR